MSFEKTWHVTFAKPDTPGLLVSFYFTRIICRREIQNILSTKSQEWKNLCVVPAFCNTYILWSPFFSNVFIYFFRVPFSHWEDIVMSIHKLMGKKAPGQTKNNLSNANNAATWCKAMVQPWCCFGSWRNSCNFSFIFVFQGDSC